MKRISTILGHFVWASVLCVTYQPARHRDRQRYSFLHDAGQLVYRRWAPETRSEGERVRGTQFREP